MNLPLQPGPRPEFNRSSSLAARAGYLGGGRCFRGFFRLRFFFLVCARTAPGISVPAISNPVVARRESIVMASSLAEGVALVHGLHARA